MSICCIFNSRFFLSLSKSITMKTTLLFLSIFLSANIIWAQSLFEKTDLVDEFGDKIGEVQRNIAVGVVPLGLEPRLLSIVSQA